MSTIFVLIIVSHVYTGATVSMQEFSSQKSCEDARTFILEAESKVSSLAFPVANCLPK